MMKWLNKFRKMRRQYGSVKAAILLFLFAGYFIVQNVSAVISYTEFMNQKVEYQIAVYAPEGVQKSDITRLEKIENVLCMSPQQMSSITCRIMSEEVVIPVAKVQAEYLKNAYGLHAGADQTCFYLNQSAWEMIMNGRTGNSVHMDYTAEDMAAGNASFILIDTLKDDTPMAYTSGNSVSLAGSNAIQLMCSKNDITGGTLQKISRMGYRVTNEQEIREGMHELEIVILKIKYGMMIAALAFLFGSVLMREAYREEARKKK